MDQLVDLLVLTGSLSALFCLLGIIARICERAEQQYRLVIGLAPKQPQLEPTRERKLPVKKAEAKSKARPAGKSVRVAPGLGVHHKAA